VSGWTADELETFTAQDELRVAALRRDGTLTRPRIVWVVRIGDEVFVRSVNGPEAAWYRATRVRHAGHIRCGDVEKDVTFDDAAADPTLKVSVAG
jgi:hypothetical protein